MLRGAREGGEGYNLHSQSVKSTTIVNRAQLTPLKNDTYEKARGDLAFEAIAEKKKVQKLNPIQGGHDSRKYL